MRYWTSRLIEDRKVHNNGYRLHHIRLAFEDYHVPHDTKNVGDDNVRADIEWGKAIHRINCTNDATY